MIGFLLIIYVIIKVNNFGEKEVGDIIKNGKPKINHLYRILALCFWILVWELASQYVDSEILLASPVQVLSTLAVLVQNPEFWQTIAFSSLRIVLGFMLAVIAGILLAILSYGSRMFYELITPLIKVIKAMPVASFIILALVWITSTNLSVLISFLMVLPVIYSNVLQGLTSADEKLLQMAEVFRLGIWKRIKAIYIPAITPYLLSAISVGLGFGFKSGIAAEVIGYPAGSIGRRLYEAKLYLLTKELFAWSIVIILISVLFEKVVLYMIHSLQKRGRQ